MATWMQCPVPPLSPPSVTCPYQNNGDLSIGKRQALKKSTLLKGEKKLLSFLVN
jgi:hypothetical protein